jgi:tRNA pseudouridine13 synthase
MTQENLSTDQRATRLKEAMQQLPYITEDLPGIGGTIKVAPEHFQVEEILPYAACGEGEHVFLTVRRQGWNTEEVATELAARFGIKSADIGWGGRKDKQAVTTQTFSLLLPLRMSLTESRQRLTDLPFELLAMNRHRNKIKTGHVAANRFRILLSQVPSESLERALAIADALRQRGLPNFFGEQRFGIQMANIDRAIRLLKQRQVSRGKKDAFMVSVLQSALYNVWLSERMRRGQYRTILSGDVAQKTDTGGLFVVEDPVEANERFASGAIVYTGPIFGPKMKAAANDAESQEAQILKEFDLDMQDFRRLKSPGTRRQAVLYLDDMTIEGAPSGLIFSFTLPSGAYATTVLREFIKN